MGLREYNTKRDFGATPEPEGKADKAAGGARHGALRFVVQKHDASHLHYDVRLEVGGVMKSWAVPKGPSLDPAHKRLAMMTEDHPISYNTFEGHIPEGQYGAGDVIVWDAGTYREEHAASAAESEKNMRAGLKKGAFVVFLEGKKLRGLFAFAKIHGRGENAWLMIKKHDHYASTEDITLNADSVLSSRRLIGRRETRAAVLKKKKHARMPARPKPMLAMLRPEPFDDPDWLYEIKWDGYRALARIQDGTVDLYSRNMISFNERYPDIAHALAKIPHDAILDGEIIAVDAKGRAEFQALQNSSRAKAKLMYMVFDILHLDGEDLTALPLIERKAKLAAIIPKSGPVALSEYIEGKGTAFFKAAVKRDLEGIMAKDMHAPYKPGARTAYWQKIKNHKNEEAVIAGFTEPRGSRSHFGALVLGQYKEGTLKFIGHTGTGFDERTLADLFKKLKPLVRKQSPFHEKIPINAPITWVEPKLVAELKFAEWTSGGHMRQPVFLGLRTDKKASEVTGEKTVSEYTGGMQQFTNRDKVYFPKLGLTKGDVIDYYTKIAPYILPYLKGRPESLNRHPGGVGKPNFFQKNFTYKLPAFAKTFVRKSESTGKDVHFLVCDNLDTLLYMANLGCIEINPWSSRAKKPDYPDWMVIDLDPGDNTFDELVTVAREVKRVLDLSCQKSYVKTSGKTGLHIFVPLGAKYHFKDVRMFAEMVARAVHARLPELTSIERNPKKRTKKIYLDYLQNSLGQTLAAPYSLRPTDGATVATPLRWSEVKKGLDPRKFTYKTIFTRLKKYGDLWAPLLTEGVDLKESIRCLEKELARP